MKTTKDNWLYRLFINEAKPALKRHSASSGNVIVSDGVPIEINTESEMDAILANATALDVRKIYQYTGSSGKYQTGAFYILEEDD